MDNTFNPPLDESLGLRKIDETEDMLANALKNLSMQERNQIYEDIHGVSKPIQEDPEFISQRLAAFDLAIAHQKSLIYNMALHQSREFVEDVSFRLMFLRSVDFDVDAATKRLMGFLQQKIMYFGEERLTKEITISDFNDEDIRTLQSGVAQVLREKDQSGRLVFCTFPPLHLKYYSDPVSVLRVLFFLEMYFVQRDPEIQRRGAVYIYYNTVPNRPGLTPNHISFLKNSKEHRFAMPVRVASFHSCQHERKGKASIGFMVSRQDDFVRGNAHFGSDEECLLELQRFGIPVSSFPVKADGTFDLTNHNLLIEPWLREREREWGRAVVMPPDIVARESACPNSSNPSVTRSSDSPPPSINTTNGVVSEDGIKQHFNQDALSKATQMGCPEGCLLVPTVDDVLLGRGKFFQDYPGNVNFREHLMARAAEYDMADRAKKIEMAASFVATFTSAGTRFLRLGKNFEDEDVWVEAPDKEAKKKVSQCYRTARKKSNVDS